MLSPGRSVNSHTHTRSFSNISLVPTSAINISSIAMRACDTAPEPNCPLAYHAFSVHWHHRSYYRGIVSALEEKTFHLLILAVSVAFVLVLQPLYGAIVWGSILAIVFLAGHRVDRIRSFGHRPGR